MPLPRQTNFLTRTTCFFPHPFSHCIYLILALGDLTIGTYVGTPKPDTGNFSNQGVPNQPGGFSQIETGFDSECIITGPTAPTCTYNFDLSFCRDVFNGQLPYKECRMGAFSGYGKGPGKIKITGGTDDFFGAFGQVRKHIVATHCCYVVVNIFVIPMKLLQLMPCLFRTSCVLFYFKHHTSHLPCVFLPLSAKRSQQQHHLTKAIICRTLQSR